ncbi:glycosyltransferase family 2 protein [Tessaracoccus oleiagri]|nr:glycosyltransferase family 2 protein [Tessaracoccus oleiagri]
MTARLSPMSVSVVMPVRNEEQHLEAAVARVLSQDYDGELEVILAVGPSEDATLAIAQRLADADARVRVVDNPSGYTPSGLNRAIEAARHDVIVRVDGHGELSPGYIRRAVELLERTGAANVGGVMDAVGRTPFERAVAAAYNSPYGLGGGGFHHRDTPEGPADTVFLGVFRREVLEEVGGYDEGMHRAQDWELNYRLRSAGHVVYFSPDLHVTYRPRSTFRALASQFYLTGRWRREVVRRYPETASLRYLAPPIAVAGGFGGLGAGLVGLALRHRLLGLLLFVPLVYVVFNLYASTKIPTDAAARLRLPFVLAVMHTCWGLGFLRGAPE